MDKAKFENALKEAKAQGGKRNFKQSVDLIINLKGIDIKKTDQQIEFFASIPHEVKKRTVCAFVGPELFEQAKGVCDEVIEAEEFPKYQKDKKLAKKLARKHAYFIAQANIMAQIAGAFGRALGPKGKMPNPKAGCVVPPNAQLAPLYQRLQKTMRVSAKTSTIIQLPIGTENMSDSNVVENAQSVYTQLVGHLPNEEDNIRSAYLKLTMGKPVKLK